MRKRWDRIDLLFDIAEKKDTSFFLRLPEAKRIYKKKAESEKKYFFYDTICVPKDRPAEKCQLLLLVYEGCLFFLLLFLYG
ncbi:MAG: hypothetical protein GY749_30275 [Desulfobacteraceae bacterium]|nr:hypothetical protein [Desulfobacteraceae bacterium]